VVLVAVQHGGRGMAAAAHCCTHDLRAGQQVGPVHGDHHARVLVAPGRLDERLYRSVAAGSSCGRAQCCYLGKAVCLLAAPSITQVSDFMIRAWCGMNLTVQCRGSEEETGRCFAPRPSSPTWIAVQD
jgi:hypothetical protein